MRIDEITLSNFRTFEDLTVRLDPQLTVIGGRNGAGKTTVLEGLAVALGAWPTGFASVREFDDRIPKSAPRLVRVTGKKYSSMEAVYPVRVSARGEVLGERIKWARELRHAGGRTTTGEATALRRLAKRAEQKLVEGEIIHLPVLAYYGTGRLWLQKRDKNAKPSLESRLDGYRAALEAASNQKGLKTWMERQELNWLQHAARKDQLEQTTYLHGRLTAMSRAACACLEGAKALWYNVGAQELQVSFTDGTTLPFDDLSDGQRNLIALAADVAWRALQLNPHLGAEAPARATGVILIDEVDLHLHPAWQRQVLGNLLRAFPRLQFIVTTHSPQVMSTAPKGTVRLIDGAHRVQEIDSTLGKDSNTLLEGVFEVGARPPEYQERLDLLARHIDEDKLSEARELLTKLAAELGEDDPSVVSARWELRMAEGDGAADR